jgi:molybdopterin molybdotransferase
MLSVESLQQSLAQTAAALPAQPVPLELACGLILAEPLHAANDEPPFDRSAMDGFAVPEDSVPGDFEIIGECLPGEMPSVRPKRGQALRVFTGSALPPKVRVVMQESSTPKGTKVGILSTDGPPRAAATSCSPREPGSHPHASRSWRLRVARIRG